MKEIKDMPFKDFHADSSPSNSFPHRSKQDATRDGEDRELRSLLICPKPAPL